MTKNIAFLIMIVLFAGCGPKIIHEEEIIIKDGNWKKEQALIYSFIADDTTNLFDLVFEVATNENFQFQNLYVSIDTAFPDGNRANDIVSLELSDGAGKSHGNCNGDRCKIPIQLQTNIKFQKAGKYVFSIRQYGRTEMVSGINSLTFKVIESTLAGTK